MIWIPQSTAATLHVGPFVDKDDGITPETGLTAGTVDEIGIYKAAATSLTDISGTTTFTHRAGGIYTLTLSTSDSDTLGPARVYVRDDSVCLSVFQDIMVVPAKIYSGLIANDLTELTGVPAAAADLVSMMQWVFKAFRNKRTSTSSASTVANDAGTAIGTSTDSDDGTTFTRGKFS